MRYLLFLLPLFLLGTEITALKKEGNQLSSETLKKFKETFALNSFIETGTFKGGTTATACKIFPQVHTVELSTSLYKYAKMRLISSANLHQHFGDSPQVLPIMIQNSSEGRLYWLDAHFDGGYTTGGAKPPPLPKELRAIKESGSKSDVILIGDLTSEYHFKNVQKHELASLILDIQDLFPSWTIAVLGDTMLLFNPEVYPDVTLSPLVEALTISRLNENPKEDLELVKKVIEAELFIMQSNDSVLLGRPANYPLWIALPEMGKKRYKMAAYHLGRLANTKKVHWHIQCFRIKALLGCNRNSVAQKIFDTYCRAQTELYPELVRLILTEEELDLLGALPPLKNPPKELLPKNLEWVKVPGHKELVPILQDIKQDPLDYL